MVSWVMSKIVGDANRSILLSPAYFELATKFVFCDTATVPLNQGSVESTPDFDVCLRRESVLWRNRVV
jgi:hypothetical protein